MTTAFVLTGGGSLGAVQVGMLAALHAYGVEPDLLVGTSVGAVNAAYLGGPGGTGARLETLVRLWERLRRQDVFTVDLRRWLGAARGSRPSLFSGVGLERLLERNLGYDDLEDARIPVLATATDLVTGHGLLLRTGPVVSAVRASAAVPGVLPPVVRDGRTLVDGAIGELDLLGRTAALGVDHIYLLPAGYPCAGPRPTSALGTVLTALSLLLHRQTSAQVRGYAGSARLHVVPPLCPLSISPADFSRTSALVARADDATRRWLQTPPEAPGDADVLALHTHHGRPPHPDRPPSPALVPAPGPTEGLTT